MTKLSHIELSVSDYKKSIRFYDKILIPMGFKRYNCTKDFSAYSDGTFKLVLCPTDNKFLSDGYHRKRIGLNHLAFYASSKDEVDNFVKDVLKQANTNILYEQGAFGDDDYYAVYFEDPDRIKLEYVFAPKYCDINSWPSNLEDDFDPYID